MIAEKCEGDFSRSPQAIEFLAYSATTIVASPARLSSPIYLFMYTRIVPRERVRSSRLIVDVGCTGNPGEG
jgi:hypothetical protein